MSRFDARMVGIGKRQRRRRLRALQAQRRLECESACSREARLRFLANLCGKLECGHFTENELSDARAALQARVDPRQRALALDGGKH